jgi:hypothetical protein
MMGKQIWTELVDFGMSSAPRLDRIHEVLEMPLISFLTIVFNEQIGKGKK